MRRALLLLLALGIVGLSSVPRAAPQPQQADGIVRLVADVEAALASGRIERLRPLVSSTMPAEGLAVFEQAVAGGAVSSAAVRERARRPLGTDGTFEVLAEVFVSRGRAGRLATWIMTVRPRGPNDRYDLDNLVEPASFGHLIRLTLNTATEFAVHNLALDAPDLALKMASGSAFVAEDEDGVTALVLLGKGAVTFAPRDTAEQGQLEAFSGRPAFDAAYDAAFIRLDSDEFASRVESHALTPVAVDPRDLPRAQSVFDDMAKKTYNVDLRDLAPGQWSLAPSSGSVVIEFRTARFGWLTYVRSPGDAEDVSFFDRPRAHNLSSYASVEQLATRGPYYSEDDSLWYDIERYALDLSFDPRNSWIAGRASLDLRIRAAGTSTVTLRLADSLNVSSVSSPALGRLLTMRPVGQNRVIVNLPASAVPDERVTLDIVYSGRLNPEAVDRESPAAQTPVPAPDTRQNAPDAGVTITPEPRFLYSNNVYWYPQSQVTDYATATMRIQVPSEYQVVANGSLARSSVGPATGTATPGGAGAAGGSIRTLEYVVDRPTRYLSCLITRLVEVGHTIVNVPAVAGPAVAAAGASTVEPSVKLEIVSTPRVAHADRALPARVAEMIRVYAGLVGEAPYPNLTVAGVEDNLPGGHSPAGFAIWLQPLSTTPFIWAGDPLSLDSRYPQFFLAHEVAHQWWGQAVGWKNYHEQWLSEGLAQYFAAVFAGRDRGPDMLQDLVGQMRDSAAQYSARGPISLGYRLGHVQGNSKIFRAVLYNKSAVVLHMLRRLIGDDAFFAGLRRYYRSWRFNKAGTDDLRLAFEAETPMRLGRFFEQWIRETTLPRLRVTTRTDAAGRSALIRIEQVGEIFDLPLTIGVHYLDGRSESVTIPVTQAITERTIALTGPVKRIVTRDDLTLAEYVK